jgi:hypothetical protein
VSEVQVLSQKLRAINSGEAQPQALLGHSHMATTLEVHTHASGSVQRDAVNLLEEQLFPNAPKLESCGIAETESQLVQ